MHAGVSPTNLIEDSVRNGASLNWLRVGRSNPPDLLVMSQTTSHLVLPAIVKASVVTVSQPFSDGTTHSV